MRHSRGLKSDSAPSPPRTDASPAAAARYLPGLAARSASGPAPAGAQRGRENRASVHDLVVRERLELLARDAAKRLRGLVASGEEIPFGVAGPDEGSAFSQYAPQTGRFVREHWAALAELDAFSEARAALVAAEFAGPYLDQLDEPVPPDEDRRAEAALINLLPRLWEGYSDFPTDGEPLAAALRELEGCAETPDAEAEVVAPLIGFHMPTVRLALEGATLVRADVVDVPDEVRRTEGTRHAAWEPQFLAVVRGPAAADEDPGSI